MENIKFKPVKNNLKDLSEVVIFDEPQNFEYCPPETSFLMARKPQSLPRSDFDKNIKQRMKEYKK
jgi:hypothetical protein